MKPSLATFLSFLLVSVAIIAGESLFLFSAFQNIESKLTQNNNQLLEFAKREAALQMVGEKSEGLEQKASMLLAGYTPEPLSISQETFGDLFLLGVQISPLEQPGDKEAKIWTYKLSSTTIEYHRLMPAISELENQYPTGRFIEIDLKSTRPPFAMSPGPVNFTGIFATLRGRR